MTVFFGVLAVAALVAAAWLGMRCALLKRSLRQADRELREIAERLEDNRIVHLPGPDADLEALLQTVNSLLGGIRRQRVLYARHEQELKEQIERISHDLRTPLTSIQGYLALVDDAALDAEARASLAVVERKAASLQRLIAQFYELSRAQGGGLALEAGPVDAGRAVRESVTGQYRLLAERGLDVRLTVPEHPVMAVADADALDRALSNLLHNAGKYARTALEVSAAHVAGHVSIAFANDVESLDEAQVDRLFEPFYTADASRARESSGLGLTIARHLVESMGGTLVARLERREGAPWIVFEMTLDAAEVATGWPSPTGQRRDAGGLPSGV